MLLKRADAKQPFLVPPKRTFYAVLQISPAADPVSVGAGQWLRIWNFLNAACVFKTPCTISRLPSTCLPNSLA